MNIKLSKHVWRHEVECKCGCGFGPADVSLLIELEACIDHFEKEANVEHLVVTFNSWCRCPFHNTKEGGSKKSQHPLGQAVDFSIEGVHPDKVADYLEKQYPVSHGVGRYDTFTHFDRRSTKARWGNRVT